MVCLWDGVGFEVVGAHPHASSEAIKGRPSFEDIEVYPYKLGYP